MRPRAWGVLAVGFGLLLTACGGDDTAARLAEAEQRIEELEQELAAATTSTSGSLQTTSSTWSGSTSTVSTTTLPAGAYPVAEADVCVVGTETGDEVNVRSGPAAVHAPVGTLAADATGVHATGWAARDGNGDEWRQILFEDGAAWVFARFLTPWSCTVDAAVDYCVNEEACADTPNVRTGLGSAYSIIGTLEPDAVGIPGTGAITHDDQGRLWVQISYEDGVGWVAGWLLDPEPCSPAECPPPPLPWTITADGVGPIQLGMPIAGLGEVTGFTWDFSEDCAVGCLTGTAAGLGVVIFAHDGTVVDEIDVYEAGDAATAAGIRVGDSPAEVESAYGSRVVDVTDDGYGGTAMWIDVDGDGTADLVALVDGSQVTAIRLPAVLSEGCC